MTKLVAMILTVAALVVTGCQTCTPCKFNADKDKAKVETQKVIDDIKAQPASAEPAK